MKCPRCQQENPPQANFCMVCGTPSVGTDVAGTRGALAEALARENASREIVRVMSGSLTDDQPVFDTIVRNAARVCGALDAVLALADGDDFVQRAHCGPIETELGARYPLRGTVGGHAILEARVIQVENAAEATDYPLARAAAQRFGYGTTLSVPLLREGIAIGAITIRRTEVRPFGERQIALLQTFADQAVIAIENVRLFTELQEKNRALILAHAQATQALEQQTATAELLKVIGRSTSDLEPVFKTLAESAVRLCEAEQASIFRFDGRLLRAVVTLSLPAAQRDVLEQNPIVPGRGSGAGRAAIERRTVHIHDVQADPEYTYGGKFFFRTLLAVPMFRAGELLGAISIQRDEVRPFTDNHIALMETFADQAVIAIENVRLFNELGARTAELTRSVEELTALAEVSRALGSTLNLDTVLATIVARAIQLSETDAGTLWEYDPTSDVFHLRAADNLEEDIVSVLRATPLQRGEGTVGRLADTRAPIQIADVLEESTYRGRLEVIVRSGYRAILSVPLLLEDQLIGALTVNAKTPREFPPAVVDLLTTFATQSALAIQNARLFREIEQKSRELAVASQHKSEFLANMSHELRTPLNAVIGFSEVLIDRMFGELNEKQEEYLKDIHASGQHLLSLINDILDLSKVEARKMELELSECDMSMTIDDALMLVRERAARRSIALHTAVDERLAQIHADGRKIRQVLLNLLSNAIKFTPEGGRIEVAAKPVDGCIEVSVSDTGVGIAREDHEAVFEEFRQVGAGDKKIEGTGLGLALSRKFVELHGGKIWVKSQVGAGSTFTFTVPVRDASDHIRR